MTFWNEQADHLEAALLAKTAVLAQHYLRTAPADDVWNLAGYKLPQSIATHDGVKASLVRQLKQPSAVAEVGCFWSEMADELRKALLANPRALALHYLRTTPAAAAWELAGDDFPHSIATRDGVKATLVKQLKQLMPASGATVVH